MKVVKPPFTAKIRDMCLGSIFTYSNLTFQRGLIVEGKTPSPLDDNVVCWCFEQAESHTFRADMDVVPWPNATLKLMGDSE